MKPIKDFENKIICADCIDILKQIPDKSIDLVVTDPPYNIGKAEWDKIENYEIWIKEAFLEIQRVLKDNGSFYWFHSEMEVVADIMNWLRKDTNFIFRQFIVWNKRFRGTHKKGYLDGYLAVDALRNYQQMAEYCLYYTFQDESGLSKIKHDLKNFTTLRKYSQQFQEAIGLSLKQINEILGHRKAEHFFYWKSTQWELPTQGVYAELCKLCAVSSAGYKNPISQASFSKQLSGGD